jgi:hypothetical protein
MFIKGKSQILKFFKIKEKKILYIFLYQDLNTTDEVLNKLKMYLFKNCLKLTLLLKII